MSILSELKRKIELENLTPVYRFAPCPSGAMTIGHLKGLLLLKNACTETNGVLKLRFDDSDLSKSNQFKNNYYDVFARYNVKFQDVMSCSDDFSKYGDYVHRLIRDDYAFICSCTSMRSIDSNISTLQYTCTCDQRKRSDQEFESVTDGSICVRFKSDPSFVIYRCTNGVWCPTIALQGPVDDYLQNVNVILRGRDLESLCVRQKLIHRALFDTPYPICFYWGRISLWNSKTTNKWTVSKRLYANSTNFPTLSFFKRWGYPDEAIEQFLLSYGFTKNDIKLDVVKLHHYTVKNLKRGGRFVTYTDLKAVLRSGTEGYVRWAHGPEIKYGYKRGRAVLSYSDSKYVRLRSVLL